MASKAASGQGAKGQSNPPNQTLYCTNLPDKLQKADLRRSLYILFATYGTVLDVVALKTMKMRGQAHIVFKDVQSSTQAMRTLQGFEFFGKEIKISYAKGKSNTIAKLDGTFKMPDANPTPVNASTELQHSIFHAQPGASTTDASKGATDKGLQGIKRTRDDESDVEDERMEEDDDEGEAMEESDDD